MRVVGFSFILIFPAILFATRSCSVVFARGLPGLLAASVPLGGTARQKFEMQSDWSRDFDFPARFRRILESHYMPTRSNDRSWEISRHHARGRIRALELDILKADVLKTASPWWWCLTEISHLCICTAY